MARDGLLVLEHSNRTFEPEKTVYHVFMTSSTGDWGGNNAFMRSAGAQAIGFNGHGINRHERYLPIICLSGRHVDNVETVPHRCLEAAHRLRILVGGWLEP